MRLYTLDDDNFRPKTGSNLIKLSPTDRKAAQAIEMQWASRLGTVAVSNGYIAVTWLFTILTDANPRAAFICDYQAPVGSPRNK